MTDGPVELRDYQREAVDAVLSAWGRGVQNVAIIVPTGGGKTITKSVIVKAAVDRGLRVVMLAHRNELVDQIERAVKNALGPLTTVGVVNAERKEYSAPVVVASVQTLSRGKHLEQLGRRDVVLVDECFVAGTLVGGRPIETIQAGDYVQSWNEVTQQSERHRVVRTMRSRPSSLVRVTFSDGQSFVCTPGHPFLLTDGSWQPAGTLRNGASVIQLHHDKAKTYGVSLDRPLLPLPGGYPGEYCEPEALLAVLPQGVLLIGMQSGIPGTATERDTSQTHIPGNRSVQRVRGSRSTLAQITARSVDSEQHPVLLAGMQSCEPIPSFIGTHGANEPQVRLGAYEAEQSNAPRWNSGKGIRHAAGTEARAEGSRWERESDSGTAADVGRAPGMADRGDDRASGWRPAPALQGGYRSPDYARAGGSVWKQPRVQAGEGRTQGLPVGSVRVVDVEILEPGSDGRYGGLCPDGFVYNLEVDTTHTYTVGDGVVVHNCHHYLAPTYLELLRRLGVTVVDRQGVRHDGHAYFCGVTATLRREDGTRMADLIDEIAYETDLRTMIDRGYLVPPRGLTVKIPGLELNKVRTVAGDFKQAELDEAIAAASSAIVHAIATHAADRHIIVFVPGVDSAHDAAEKLTEAGIEARAVTGAMAMDERRPIYADYMAGAVQALVTVQVLTEGADFPRCDAVVMARPTKSKIVYAQCIGRGLRLWPGKSDCLVLDITGVSRVMGLVNLTDLYGQAKRAKVTEDGDEQEMTPEEIEDEQAAKMPPPPKAKREGPQEYERIDLFSGGAASDWVWLETHGRVPFLAARDRVVFLWPAHPSTPAADGTPGWLVGTRRVGRDATGPEGWVASDEAPMHEHAEVFSRFPVATVPWSDREWSVDATRPGPALTAAEAYARAEAVAASLTTPPVRHDEGWRRTSKPTDGQVSFARQIGIPNPDSFTRARLSDDLSVHVISRILDPHTHITEQNRTTA